MEVRMGEDYSFAGFGVGGYRCFAFDHPGSFGPFGKIHILTGQNNSGKSALLQCAAATLNALRGGARLSHSNYPFNRDDVPHGGYSGVMPTTRISLCFTLESLMENEAVKRRPGIRGSVRTVLESEQVCRGDAGYVWIDFTASTIEGNMHGGQDLLVDSNSLKGVGKGINLSDLSMTLSSRGYASPEENAASVISSLIPWISIPSTVVVEAIRKVSVPTGGSSDEKDSSGYDLPRRLLRLSNPVPAEQHVATEKWDRFVAFVRGVLNDPAAEVRIDADASMIQVSTAGAEFIPLARLGTGIEELVIIAATVATEERKLICIEEPEIHLHSSLQMRLLRYLE